MSENEQTVHRAADALAAGDMETVRSAFAEDVVVHVPPGLPISATSPPKAEVHDFTSSADHVVGLYMVRAERGGTSYEWPHVNVYHVSNGRITELWWSPFDLEMVQRALAE